MLWFSYVHIQWVSSCLTPASTTSTVNLYIPWFFWILLLLELSNPPKIQLPPRERFVLQEVSAELAVVLRSHPGEMERTKEKAGSHKPGHSRAR